MKPGSKATHLPWHLAEETALRLDEKKPQDIECPAVFFMLREKGDSSLNFSIRFVFRRDNDKTNDEQSYYKRHKQNHSNGHRVSPLFMSQEILLRCEESDDGPADSSEACGDRGLWDLRFDVIHQVATRTHRTQNRRI